MCVIFVQVFVCECDFSARVYCVSDFCASVYCVIFVSVYCVCECDFCVSVYCVCV